MPVRFDVGGVHLNVEGDVDVADVSTPTLLLLHGFTQSSRTWSRLPPFRDLRRLAVDAIGHGESDAPDDASSYTFDAMTAQLARLVETLDAAPCILVGYSFGGRLALHFARAHPDLVRALVLESASPGIMDAGQRGTRRARDGALARLAREDGIEAFVDAWLAQPPLAYARRSPDAFAEARRERLRGNPTGFAHGLEQAGQGTHDHLLLHAAAIDVPVLLVAGERDEKGRRDANALNAVMRRSKLRVVPGCGHAPHEEAPDAFHDVVQSFLHRDVVRAEQIPEHAK